MTYARIDNGKIVEYPVYEGDIRLRHPHVSFPADFIPPSDYVSVEMADCPDFDYTKNAVQSDPKLVGSKCVVEWVILDASSDEVAERVTSQWNLIRSLRNMRLIQCDWTQLPDAPVDAAIWAEYRQALRDVTTQTDPFNIVWPEPPQS